VDAHTERALRYLAEVSDRTRARAVYSPAEFAEQKRWLGYCAVTNLLCGEAAEEAGRPLEAEAEYEEVIRMEPGNSWGFLKRALLRQRMGRPAEARADLDEVLALAPGNPEALELAQQWHQKGHQKGQPKGQRKAKGQSQPERKGNAERNQSDQDQAGKTAHWQVAQGPAAEMKGAKAYLDEEKTRPV